MSQLPKLVRDRLAGSPAAPVHGSHPDADLLTAFVEGSISEREREQLLSHLAACADCRDVVALSTPEFVGQPELQVAATPAPHKKWWNMSALRWASVSATAVIVLAAALLIRPAPKSQSLYTSSERVTLTSDVREKAGPRTEDAKAKKPGEAAPANERVLVASDTGASRDKLEARQQVKGVPQIAPERSLAKVAAEPAPPQRSDLRVPARRAATPPANAGAISSNMVAAAPAAVVGGAVGGSVALDHEADRAQAPAPPTKMVASEKKAPAATNEAQLQSQAKEIVNTQVAELGNQKLGNQKDDLKLSDQVASARAQAPVASKQAAGSASGVGPGRDAATSTETETGAGVGAAAGVNRLAASGARSAVEVMATPTSIVNANLPRYRWTIDGSGKLKRSSDGETWEVVPVAEGAKLQSLAVVEREIWTGGAVGLLYHSDDGGNRWTRVRPVVGDNTLQDDITRITVPSPQHVSLTTSSGQLWTSSDGGKTWRKQ